MSSVEQTRVIEAIRNLANLEQRLAPIRTTTNVLILQRQATRESLNSLGIAARRVLEAFIANRENLRTIIERINKEVADGTTLQTQELSRFIQSLEASVADNNSEDDINSLIYGIHQLIGEIDREIPPPRPPSGSPPENDRTQLIQQQNGLLPPPPSSQPPPQNGGFVWRTPPKTPNTPRLTLNKTPNPVRNNGLIRTKTRKTRTKTKKSNPKTIISRRTRSKSRS